MPQVQAPTPPAPPAIPAPPELVAPPGSPTVVSQAPAAPTTASASEVFEAFKAQRNELTRQLSQLEEKRRAIASRLRDGEVSGADKLGLETRLTELDGQITEMYKKVATANDQVARAAAQPGAVVTPPPGFNRQEPPEEVLVMGFVLAMTLVLPISIAFARRIWRRGAYPSTPAPISRELDERLGRLEQAMDAVAVEVERVGEGQRYMTRVLGSGAAEPLSVRARDAVEVKR